jgi:hypothetical protein
VLVWRFGAKPAQSETPVRAAAKRHPTRKRTKWKNGVVFHLKVLEVNYGPSFRRSGIAAREDQGFGLTSKEDVCACDYRFVRRLFASACFSAMMCGRFPLGKANQA